MTSNSMLRERLLWCTAVALTFAGSAIAENVDYHFGGHIKTRLVGQTFADDSIFHDLTGSSALDFESDLRLNLEVDRGPWDFQASYQLFVFYGDRTEYSRVLPDDLALLLERLPTDSHRLFDFTNIFHDEDKFASGHRLDRIWIGFSSDKAVVRVGRQALSWGNGFFYAPMDIVNPFDPTTVDTEYKAGDDMIYGQYLQNNGHDVQAAAVFRRDIFTGSVASDQGTTAVKYHGLAGEGEYDILLAEHYGDLTLGLGGNRSIGGAVLRGDIVVSDSDESTEFQLVTNLSYAWIWHEKNMSGVVEYYYNGFGQKSGDYEPSSIADNPELLKRLARGDVFTLGRNYVAAGLTIEITPLWMITPNIFTNIDDGSALLQFVTEYSLGNNATFLGSISLPLGPNGSEFGGIPTGMQDRFLSTDLNLFAQFAWYF